ncbi:TonB-dependent receptor [Nitrospirillum iridis]|uniref:Outer membrane receptor protein involved in Fe transport n=1 Tax=Nitrospirillum iridis TaxID=765888 RepID=A0A7X0AUZ6_9PROT|nr:TonB-dependent receptor [Nitrospirillum iridis]MBB6250157.1 outer membrane receptor protein involved in Fe transport [Nitrospirillum iridis]
MKTAVGSRFRKAAGTGLLMSTSLLALAAWSNPALAQQAAPQGSAPGSAQTSALDDLQEIVVTGTHIKGQDAQSVGNIQSLSIEDIQAAAPLSVGDLLQALPSVGVSLNSNGTQGTSFGVSSINLRYLGSAEGSGNRTLVLVDGHRWVNAVGGRGFRDFVDLNTIPVGLVDTMEVLKDGASAIYGADAIAGVVNIHLVRDFEGVRANVQSGISSNGDGRSVSADMTAGVKLGRGTLLFSADLVDILPIYTQDRDLTRVALTAPTSPPISPRGLYNLPGVSSSTLTRIAGTDGTSTSNFRAAALPGDYFNTLVQGRDATGPSTRYGTFLRYTTDITDSVSGHVEFLYNHRRSAQLYSPFLLDVNGGQGITMPANQAYNIFGKAFSGSSFRLRRYLDDVGDRQNVQEVNTWRADAGLEGKVDLWGTWNWDAFVSYSRNEATFDSANNVDYDHLALALGSPTRCAATAGCVPLNIFGKITPQMANYIRYNAHDEDGVSQTSAEFNLSRSLFTLPAGDVMAAAGASYRREYGYDTPDAVVNATPVYVTGLTRTSAATRNPTSGSYDTKEAYAEFDIPLLRDLPAIYKLDVDGALRYSNYSTYGGNTTKKAGVAYRPVEDLLFRGSYSEGFRAPSILELDQGGRNTQFQAVDPCNGGGKGLAGCAGVPTSYSQYNYGNGLINGSTGGNPNLKPETSRTDSVGLAYTPAWAKGASATVDYFAIEVDDAISSQTAQQILTSCANTGGSACSLLQRDATTGQVLNVLQAVSNFSKIKEKGVDVSLGYTFDSGFGIVTTGVNASRLLQFDNYIPQPDGSILRQELAGHSDQPRATYPYWKGQASLRWNQDDEGPWSAGWKARYIGTSRDIPNNAVNGGRIPAIVYQDVQVGYNFRDLYTRVTLGVDNIFNVQPPASAANNPINFDMYTYDVRGTYLYMRLQFRM